MFSILINYTDFFDLELLQTIDEFFLNYSVSKQPIEILLDKIIHSSILILFLPFCQKQTQNILDLLSKSDRSPRFVFCLANLHCSKIEQFCLDNSFFYFSKQSFTTNFVNKLLKIKSNLSPHILTHKNLTLNTHSRKCSRGTSNVILTNQEFYLLKYLLENKERSISKAELLESVWGFKSSVATRSLDVYISRLRAKIDDQFDTKYIKTIHCYGYVMS